VGSVCKVLQYPQSHQYESYIGEVVDGKPGGLGILKLKNGDVHFGHFKQGLKDGLGVVEFSRSKEMLFLGYKDDGTSGKAKAALILRDGETCIGDYREGSITGFGFCNWPFDNFYVGNFLNNEKSGSGNASYSNGDTYVGHWKNNRKHGSGKFIFGVNDPTGSKSYEGSFVDGKKTGNGTFTWKDGNRYVGNLENGVQSGFGVFYYASGEKYVGFWRDGDRNGLGTMYSADGKITYNGTWSDGNRK